MCPIPSFGGCAGSSTPLLLSCIAAVLPLPKKRPGVAPTGYTRRYGNTISRRMQVVRREGLDSCLR